jgi:aquaporin Z
MLAQLGGAFAAALLLRALFGPLARAGVMHPHWVIGVLPAFVMETILALLLVFVILGTAEESQLVGPNAALAVGGTVALAGLFASPISGAAMNPALALAPQAVAGSLHYAWIYVAGPLLGAALATAATYALHGPPKPKEAEVSQGRPGQE